MLPVQIIDGIGSIDGDLEFVESVCVRLKAKLCAIGTVVASYNHMASLRI